MTNLNNLDALEDHVIDTVECAADNVGETVATVTKAVQETAASARDLAAVGKGAVQELAMAVSDALDIKARVRQNPWTALGLSVTIGYLAQHWLGTPVPGEAAVTGDIQVRATSPRSEIDDGRSQLADSVDGASRTREKTHPVIAKLENLAIATVIGVVRDATAQAVPPSIAGKLQEVFDSATARLGADPIPGPILPRSERTCPRAVSQSAGDSASEPKVSARFG